MNEIELRLVVPEDRPAIRALYRASGWGDSGPIFDDDFYEWQFRGLDGHDASLVAIASNEIVSFLGMIETMVSTPSQRRRGGQLLTWLAVPEVRGSGIGTMLMGHLTAEYDFLFGKGVSPEALAVYQKFGFRYLPESSRWIMIIDPASARDLAMDESPITRKRLEARVMPSARAPSYIVSDEVPRGATRIAAEALSEAVAFVRSERLLKWRYEEHPFFEYRFVCVGERAMAVVREERFDRSQSRVIRVVEFFECSSVRGVLAVALADYARSRGAAFIDLIGISERFLSGVVSSGGFLEGEEPDIRLPYDDQALRPSSAPDFLLYSKIRTDGGLQIQSDLTRMYLSRGDGSCEWPVVPFESEP